ncbi:RNA polymerase sigma factor [Kitasatospora sp. NPDC001540]|uniref:RNA polymerase sigma factor n=1 Tax=Kitasatospora sp. NPDC001540 TaxID=3364014 RepID=UPI0036CE88A5
MRTAGRTPLAAYAELYRRHHPGLLRYAGSLTGGDRWRAEDLVAEAHLRVWRRLADGHRIEDPRAYLAATVRHLAAAPVRERAAGELPGRAAGEEAADPAPRVAETDRMRGLLAQLPARWARALWLSEVEGLPPGEVGDRLGVGRGAAAVLLHRAREGLRLAYLRAYPGAPRDPGCAGHWAALAGRPAAGSGAGCSGTWTAAPTAGAAWSCCAGSTGGWPSWRAVRRPCWAPWCRSRSATRAAPTRPRRPTRCATGSPAGRTTASPPGSCCAPPPAAR